MASSIYVRIVTVPNVFSHNSKGLWEDYNAWQFEISNNTEKFPKKLHLKLLFTALSRQYFSF
jgi:hypothetical protein